jgi:hypothetical protein
MMSCRASHGYVVLVLFGGDRTTKATVGTASYVAASDLGSIADEDSTPFDSYAPDAPQLAEVGISIFKPAECDQVCIRVHYMYAHGVLHQSLL